MFRARRMVNRLLTRAGRIKRCAGCAMRTIRSYPTHVPGPRARGGLIAIDKARDLARFAKRIDKNAPVYKRMVRVSPGRLNSARDGRVKTGHC